MFLAECGEVHAGFPVVKKASSPPEYPTMSFSPPSGLAINLCGIP